MQDINAQLEKNYSNLLTAASPAGQDAADLVGDFTAELLGGDITPPADSDFAEWASRTIADRARKAKNRVTKEKLHPKFLHYTDTPTTPAANGEISEDQLWDICTTKEDEPRLSPKFQHRLAMLKSVFTSLPLADQEFLKKYQTNKAKDLVPRYGKTEEAIRKRNQRLKSLIRSQLQVVLREPKEMSRL